MTASNSTITPSAPAGSSIYLFDMPSPVEVVNPKDSSLQSIPQYLLQAGIDMQKKLTKAINSSDSGGTLLGSGSQRLQLWVEDEESVSQCSYCDIGGDVAGPGAGACSQSCHEDYEWSGRLIVR